MSEPHDVNNSQMRAVYGNRLRIDNPLLGDNPKVAALKDDKLKTIIDESLKKFFFPETESDTGELESPLETEKTENTEKTETDKTTLLMSLFKMLLDTVFSAKMKG